MELTILALLIATVVAVPLGALSAVYQDSPLDYLSRSVTILGIALPNFWVAIMVLFILSNEFWPHTASPGLRTILERPRQQPSSVDISRFRVGLVQHGFCSPNYAFLPYWKCFREDYIRTARSKGLAEGLVIRRHALKNALLPVVTVSAYEFGRLMGGTVIIEKIFNVPGMGWLLLSAISQRDFPMIQAIVIVLTGIVLVLNVVTDLLYAWLNPRIRYA